WQTVWPLRFAQEPISKSFDFWNCLAERYIHQPIGAVNENLNLRVFSVKPFRPRHQPHGAKRRTDACGQKRIIAK
ncbi:MAG: hypothetical protein AAGL92_11680, partial [Pseudomonadota bacterium]